MEEEEEEPGIWHRNNLKRFGNLKLRLEESEKGPNLVGREEDGESDLEMEGNEVGKRSESELETISSVIRQQAERAREKESGNAEPKI